MEAFYWNKTPQFTCLFSILFSFSIEKNKKKNSFKMPDKINDHLKYIRLFYFLHFKYELILLTQIYKNKIIE